MEILHLGKKLIYGTIRLLAPADFSLKSKESNLVTLGLI